MADLCKKPRVVAVIALVAACVLCAPSWLAYAQSRNDFEVRSLSTRADAVSGGNVLVQIRVPGSVAADKLSVTLNGRDVRSAFRPAASAKASASLDVAQERSQAQEPNILLGLVTGLQVGKNQLDIAANGKSLGKLALPFRV